MPDGFQNTALWRRTLGLQDESDQFAGARDTLRDAYLSMRKNAAELVKLIPQDCRSLTVHDITHLDALWETADLISGPDFPINPAEAFVFGAAILLHDAGMTVAAYPGGMAEIAQTTEWKDAVYAFYRKRDLPEPHREALQNPPDAFREEILFGVLRGLHARQAENLIGVRWRLPSTGEEVSLLENQHLRLAYGRIIGRIAHSHHWDVERLNVEFRDTIGAATELPGEWTLNEIKVACLLRCADASHIDHRRAPTMLYALSKPKGASDVHWRFQHKLNKATSHLSSLLYTSGQDFNVEEAPAWWLCFDTIRMIDRELSSSNAVLQDIGCCSFAISQVYGAESPRIFARHVRPSGWRPVDAEVKVSDPASLAQTLGGRHLYGRGAYAPVRELLQNAVDAVRARRRLEDREPAWGYVRLVLENVPSSSGDEMWLHVDDQGVRMSERVLVGPLIDFGRSLWNSPLLQEEFPGLESRGIKPIGKFGIGFFSIFLLGQHVKVVTRPYTGGAGDTKVLEFSSLSSRPILRVVQPPELPIDYTTRISVHIANPKDVTEGGTDVAILSPRGRRGDETLNIHQTLARLIRRLVAALDVQVEITDKIAGTSYVHKPDWKTSSPHQFLREILSDFSDSTKPVIDVHEHLLSDIESTSGEHLGRAALWMSSDDRGLYSRKGVTAYVSVGGFAYPSYGWYGDSASFKYVGVLSGDTDSATRQSAHPEVSPEVIAAWLTKQAERIDLKRFQIYEALRACHTVLQFNGDPRHLPFCFSGGAFRSFREFEGIASSARRLHIPISKTYDDNFEFVRIEDLGTTYFALNPVPELVVVQLDTTNKLFSTEQGRDLVSAGSGTVSFDDFAEDGLGAQGLLLLKKIEEVWGIRPTLEIGSQQVFSDQLYQPPRRRWVLTAIRPAAR